MNRTKIAAFCLLFLPAAIFSEPRTKSDLSEHNTIRLNDKSSKQPVETEEIPENIDDIFDDAEDTQISEEQEKASEKSQKENAKPKIFSYNGSLSAGAGYVVQVAPEITHSPYASFEARLGLALRPADVITMRTEMYAKFSDMKDDEGMEWKLDTLYLDYILLNTVYITVGRTGMKWGNARIFDTDILDDGLDTLTTDASILTTTKTESSQYFDAMVTVPIHHGQAQALLMYYPFSGTINEEDLCFAASVEYPFGPVAVNVFARSWAPNDEHRMDPALGVQISSEVSKFQIGAWGKINFNASRVQYSKAVLSVARVWEKPKIGFALEYQHVYNAVDYSRDATNSDAIAWSWTWRHVGGSDFSPLIQGFTDMQNACGAVIPGLSYTGLPFLTITLIAPIFYGDQTDVDYNDVTISSTSGTPTVMLGLIVKLKVTF